MKPQATKVLTARSFFSAVVLTCGALLLLNASAPGCTHDMGSAKVTAAAQVVGAPVRGCVEADFAKEFSPNLTNEKIVDADSLPEGQWVYSHAEISVEQNQGPAKARALILETAPDSGQNTQAQIQCADEFSLTSNQFQTSILAPVRIARKDSGSDKLSLRQYSFYVNFDPSQAAEKVTAVAFAPSQNTSMSDHGKSLKQFIELYGKRSRIVQVSAQKIQLHLFANIKSDNGTESKQQMIITYDFVAPANI